MPHTVESTISLSEKDLARGAVDLTMEDPIFFPPDNSTLVEKAVTVVKEAAPKIIETIVSHLVPNPSVSSFPGTLGQSTTKIPMGDPGVSTLSSPPLETIVVIAVPDNHTISSSLPPADTVHHFTIIVMLCFFFFFG
jgi:hypothetical protein